MLYDRYLPAIDRFASDDLIERRSKRIVSQNADGDRRVCCVGNAAGGHSINLVKFSRNADFTWYSTALVGRRCAQEQGKRNDRHRAAAVEVAAAVAIRLLSVTGSMSVSRRRFA